MNASLRAAVIAEWRGLPANKTRPDRWQAPGDLLPKLMQQLGLSERLRESEVIDAWKTIVGEFIAAHSVPGQPARRRALRAGAATRLALSIRANLQGRDPAQTETALRRARSSAKSVFASANCFGPMLIRQIFISPGHNYFGHHGKAPDDYPLVEVQRDRVRRGPRNSRRPVLRLPRKLQGTDHLFLLRSFREAGPAIRFGTRSKSAGVLRRNVIVSGIDLNDLIGEEFEIQGVRFRGTRTLRGPATGWITPSRPERRSSSKATEACAPKF